jgi:hypothetical protein
MRTENVPMDDGRFLRMLVKGMGAKNVVEIGTSNGYSALWMLLALRAALPRTAPMWEMDLPARPSSMPWIQTRTER